MQLILKRIDSIARVLMLVFGAGVFFYLDPGAADPLAPKAACFAALGLVAVLRVFLNPEELGRFRSLGRPLEISLVLILFSPLLSLLLPESLFRSIGPFGAWLFLLAFFWTLTLLLQRSQEKELLLYSINAVLALECVWGLFQVFAINLGGLDAAARENFGSRISAGFGNPNFYAGFLVLSLPCALWLSRKHKLAWGLIALASLELLLTGSKAAWLALLFQYFCYGHFVWRGPEEKEKRLHFLKRWAGLGLLLCVLCFLALPSLRGRLSDLVSGQDHSVEFRLNTWKGSIEAFKAKPWIGHGPGSFAAVYPAFRPELAMSSQVEHSYEVAHAENWILELLVTSGILGLLPVLAFLGLILWKLWLLASEGNDLAQILFLSLVASLICNLAGLDLFLASSLLPFVALAALAAAEFMTEGSVSGLGFRSVVILALAAAIFTNWLAWKNWKASRYLEEAESLSKQSRFGEAIGFYEKALASDPTNCEAIYFEGASYEDSGRAQEALLCFDRLEDLAPDYVLVHDKKARADLVLGQKDQAALEWERQLELDPWWLPGVQGLSGLYASSGKLSDADRVLSRAQIYFPGNADLVRNLALIRKAEGKS